MLTVKECSASSSPDLECKKKQGHSRAKLSSRLRSSLLLIALLGWGSGCDSIWDDLIPDLPEQPGGSGGETCPDKEPSGENPAPECSAPSSRTRKCERCGVVQQRCNEAGQWEDAGECEAQATCSPGDISYNVALGKMRCGSIRYPLRCSQECKWENVSGELPMYMITPCDLETECCSGALANLPNTEVPCFG